MLDNDEIEEKYTGRHTKEYTGHYKCNGYQCNCSWFTSNLFCRHIIFYRKTKGLNLFDLKMFHGSFLSCQFDKQRSANSEEDSDSDDSVTYEEQIDVPASPGMEYMLKEKNESNKKLPKNVKFNRSFDIAKLCADYLKDASSQTFETYFECFKEFSRLLRDGIPSKVVNFLMDPSKYDLILKEEPEEDTSSETVDENSNEDEVINSEFVSKYIEVPQYMKEAVHVDAMIKTMPGDRACFYNCAAEWFLGNHGSMPH